MRYGELVWDEKDNLADHVWGILTGSIDVAFSKHASLSRINDPRAPTSFSEHFTTSVKKWAHELLLKEEKGDVSKMVPKSIDEDAPAKKVVSQALVQRMQRVSKSIFSNIYPMGGGLKRLCRECRGFHSIR